MYEGDPWMQTEMRDRHKGIAAESTFSLAMHRWVNKVIEFIDVVEGLDEIGINEIESKAERLRAQKDKIEALLERRSTQAPFMLFNALRQQDEVERGLRQLSESYYSCTFSQMPDEPEEELDLDM